MDTPKHITAWASRDGRIHIDDLPNLVLIPIFSGPENLVREIANDLATQDEIGIMTVPGVYLEDDEEKAYNALSLFRSICVDILRERAGAK